MRARGHEGTKNLTLAAIRFCVPSCPLALVPSPE